MSVFDKLFGKKNEGAVKTKATVPWIPLVSMGQLEEIVQQSKSKTQVIFKHSTSCGISRMVMNSFLADYSFTEDQLKLYYLDLHRYREISNGVATTFKVVHQSPQLLIIRNGLPVANASHGAITQIDLEKYL